MVAQAALARGEDDLAGPGPPGVLIARQRGGRVIGLGGERRRQHAAVLDGLTCALPQVGEHRMRGIPEDRDAPARPAGNRVSVVERPLVPGLAGGEDVLQGLVPAGVATEHLPAIALRDPRLVAVVLVVVVADDVDQLVSPHG